MIDLLVIGVRRDIFLLDMLALSKKSSNFASRSDKDNRKKTPVSFDKGFKIRGLRRADLLESVLNDIRRRGTRWSSDEG
ncbi:MAG: hypothetical protein FJX91_06465 [Bacteroidetes bacterium]|nr:hypothetical protein [Bacteroidota bacterium]